MNLDNFFSSAFSFSDNEELLKYKFRMFNHVLAIVAIFSFLFGFLSDLGINELGPIHSKVNYFYSLSAIFIIFYLRKSKNNYVRSVDLLIIASLITFTSALLLVTQDEFRMIWYFLLVFLTFILADTRRGLIVTFTSIFIILLTNSIYDLRLSSIAITSAVLGISIASLISMFHNKKVSDYEISLQEKNLALQKYASTDPLTGISNRRIFNEVCERYFETSQRNKTSLTLLILDLDRFKDINDTYGHQAGDLILIKFTESIKLLLRKSDTFARIGGEEFAILLFETDIEGAMTLSKKIHEQINAISMPYEDKLISITTSIGISNNLPTDTRFDEIFTRCDNALYHSKELGRNQTSSIV